MLFIVYDPSVGTRIKARKGSAKTVSTNKQAKATFLNSNGQVNLGPCTLENEKKIGKVALVHDLNRRIFIRFSQARLDDDWIMEGTVRSSWPMRTTNSKLRMHAYILVLPGDEVVRLREGPNSISSILSSGL